ncbi:uncharacterized protein (TIGR03086 family) [Arthrobacter sp. B3I9]|uniref:TIGR03086 family metal-binding protein n=1 Tax=Arthrobacter sp. B3I9 TaxID=3042270 RepID=UPI002791FB79|nr:TIGR03086 family metal-binding protein [Arthrobacter sp. B3I9]MDQ0849865.1 uncharacterized protein (TIGR03086 family) [Arthrobacter sp. B3I9]
MTSENTVLGLLERALAQMQAVIAAIRAEESGLPTPCTDWDVQALVRHLVTQDLPHFIESARGGTPDWTSPPGDPGTDWAGAFAEGARQLLRTWAAQDLDRPVTGPGGAQAPLLGRADLQISELAMHSWDLAMATAAEVDLDPELAEHGLAWSRSTLRPEYRGPDKAFGLEVPVPEDAPAYVRLAGWFGRDPFWSARP